MNNLAKLRGKHGLKQKELGTKLKVSKEAVSYMEKHRIGQRSAKKCADLLQENVFEIMGADVLKILPKTEEDKEILIRIIKELEV